MLSNFFQHLILAQSGNACTAASASSPQLCNAIPGVGNIQQLGEKIMQDVGSVIGLLAIAAIVYAGLRLAAANGDKNQIERGKKILTYAVVGIVISVFAYSGVIALESFIGVNESALPNPNTTFPSRDVAVILGYPNLKVFVESMIQNIMYIIGTVSLLMLIVNGFKYITARGDSTQVDSAKKGITWSLVGLGLSIFAYALVSAINSLLT